MPEREPVVDLSDVSKPWKRDPMSSVDNDVLKPALEGGALVLKGAKPAEPSPALQELLHVDGRGVIRNARANSYLEPDETAYDRLEGSEYVYEYKKGITYAVYACARMALRLELAPSEMLMGTLKFDDNSGRMKRRTTEQGQQIEVQDVGWSTEEPLAAGDGNGNTVDHLYIRPNYDSVGKQYLHFATNIGPYRVRLEVLPKDDPSCMTAIRWRHPQMERLRQKLAAARARAKEAEEQAESSDDNAANIEPFTCESEGVNRDYEVSVAKGSPSWMPTICHKVIGGHARVHIEFPPKVAWTQWPVLMKDGSPTDCQTHYAEREIRCDNLAAKYVLKLGAQGREEVVYIKRVIPEGR
jgi:type IV secretory pathway VirB9-like protein